MAVLTYDKMCNSAREDEDTEEGKGDDEEIKVSVISPAHAISHPWTVMVKSLCNKKEVRLMYEKCTKTKAEKWKRI